MKDRWMNVLLVSVLIIHFGFILFTNRALFLSHYDSQYWQDRYEHSQWKLPISSRIVGDDGVYGYLGYRLMQGDNPTLDNAEVPPLGKYLIGASIVLFGNGAIYGFITTSLTILLLFFLAKILLKNTTLALAAATLFAVDPLVTNQFTLTMLDSLNIVWILSSMLCLVLLSKQVSTKKQYLLIILSGILIGFSAETKFPLAAPFELLLCVGALLKSRMKLVPGLASFLIAATVGYLAPYTYYFFSGHSLREWVSVQKWVVHFYLVSNIKANIGSALSSILFGMEQNLTTRSWTFVAQYSLSWPIQIILTMVFFYRIIQKKLSATDYWWKLLTLFFIGVIMALSVIPFWSRYLLLFLPILVLLSIRQLSFFPKRSMLLGIFLLITINWASSILLLFPTPETVVRDVTYTWEHGFFQDMYEHVSKESQHSMSRAKFNRFGQKVFYDGEIEEAKVEFSATNLSRMNSDQFLPIMITYTTRNLGSWTEKTNLHIVKEQGLWKIVWNWNNLITNLTPSDHLETSVTEAKRGAIIKNSTVLAADFPSFLISLTPNSLPEKDQQTLLPLLQQFFNNRLITVAIHHRLFGNSEGSEPIAIGVLQDPIDQLTLNTFRRFPAVTLAPHFGRSDIKIPDPVTGLILNTSYTECCSLLYSQSSYNGITGLEYAYNQELKGVNGGVLILKDQNGTTKRKLIEIAKKDGSDVIVP